MRPSESLTNMIFDGRCLFFLFCVCAYKRRTAHGENVHTTLFCYQEHQVSIPKPKTPVPDLIIMRLILCPWTLIFCTVVVRSLSIQPRYDDSLILYVAHQARGILTLSFDPSQPASQSLQIVSTNTQGGFRPQWLSPTSNDTTQLYSLSRQQFPTVNSTDGGIFSFKDQGLRNRTLELQNAVDSGGEGGVYVDVSPDRRTLAAANIDGSTVSIHPLDPSSFILPASYLFKYTLSHPGPGTNGSQLIPNPHQSIFSPSGTHMFSPDRGSDILRVYRVNGPYNVHLVQIMNLLPGTGPRHIKFRFFSQTRTYMYLISELDNTVRVYALDTTSGQPDQLAIELKQTISTLCDGCDRTAPTNVDLASEVAISPDGSFLYASNRNTESETSDNIAVFSVHPGLEDDARHLKFRGKNAVDGKIPRHFSLSKDSGATYVAVGNQVTNDVKIFERNRETGTLGQLRGNLSLGSFDSNLVMGPTCVIWA